MIKINMSDGGNNKKYTFTVYHWFILNLHTVDSRNLSVDTLTVDSRNLSVVRSPPIRNRDIL